MGGDLPIILPGGHKHGLRKEREIRQGNHVNIAVPSTPDLKLTKKALSCNGRREKMMGKHLTTKPKGQNVKNFTRAKNRECVRRALTETYR